jgi:hypothetical protein
VSSVASHHLPKESLLGGGQLRSIIPAREQVPVAIRRHGDRGMTKPVLH